MGMFEQIGEFTPDSLIASPDFPILKEGIGLKPGQGLLKRGSLIMKGTDRAGYIAGTAAAAGEGGDAMASPTGMEVYGILTDDTDTGDDASGDNIPAVTYMTWVVNPAAILLSGEDVDISAYEKELKDVGIYLRSVQEYGGR